ncbi:MAG TPA: hypothetical protein DEG17_27530 [Cyanobacteria bacterium UBA11149]|nr:hypothetical protein [Cyanobacteria bacterium UBA11367]HBE57424.1 hypothetical protein [Cyanobacteria bacterium UBA11366]HBK66140.1 hypothetical protein [Cyanobacteria bacterium UBA11166]HBR77117.1 hypothetical protein [Cyanobacteria bacterium UBA11159]HBS69741.1 hypothetical protein [Cyanobacteria bacterium UBA11153]HBW92509.1 hypothetical protein [Cyanobacteria bacterium UBA11149]HCA97574.1 hypothetical protein [Cyanobacteria bacterium UBA9226]
MKYPLFILTAIISTIALTIPAIAQIRTPSQDFFEQGRELLERELQLLQGQNSELPEEGNKPESKPLLEVTPTPSEDDNQNPDAVETPEAKPNQPVNTPKN